VISTHVLRSDAATCSTLETLGTNVAMFLSVEVPSPSWYRPLLPQHATRVLTTMHVCRSPDAIWAIDDLVVESTPPAVSA
jgi:hypothetical protein